MYDFVWALQRDGDTIEVLLQDEVPTLFDFKCPISSAYDYEIVLCKLVEVG